MRRLGLLTYGEFAYVVMHCLDLEHSRQALARDVVRPWLRGILTEHGLGVPVVGPDGVTRWVT